MRRLLVAISMLGCSGVAPEQLATSEAPVINGTTIVAENSGHVKLLHYVQVFPEPSPSWHTCSGSLLRNDAVLTARHCITTNAVPTGPIDYDTGHYLLQMGSQLSAAAEVTGHPTLDGALVIAQRFFAKDGSRSGLRKGIYQGTNVSLVGTPLRCAGYGINAPLPGGSGTQGTLREAILTPAIATNATNLVFNMNGSGQILAGGDSGSTCTLNVSGIEVITGIASTAGSNWASSLGPEAHRTWTQGELARRGPGFIHTSGAAASYTVLDDPSFNGLASAYVFVTPRWTLGHYVPGILGVKYDYSLSKWRIETLDGSTIPGGSQFNVSVAGTETFLHLAQPSTISGHVTTLDIPSINDDPSAKLVVTQRLSFSGTVTTPNPHPFSVWYNAGVGRWTIYNDDFAAMPAYSGYNVRVERSIGVVHTATASNTSGNSTALSSINTDDPNARVFVTNSFGSYIPSALGVWFSAGRWNVFRQDLQSIPIGAKFQVVVRP